MGAINVDNLLVEISPESPCGDNLEYDPLYGEMERATHGKPEQQMGDHIIPAEPPDWRDIKNKALELLGRSKDMRIVAHMSRAVLHTDGLPAFRDAMTLMRGIIGRYWTTLHPQLDPDDNNDPTFRVNTLGSLCADDTLRIVREIPIVRSRMVGRFSLRDMEIANGELPPRADQPPPEKSAIEAAFMDCDLVELQADSAAVLESIDLVKAVEADVTQQVGAGNAVSLDPLVNVLKSIQRIYADQLNRRGVTAPGAVGTDGAPIVDGQPQPISGEISTREDVIRTLDKVCEYYERNEPSSPLPLLLRRAKRLASKSFLDIIRDLTPDALSQAESLRGLEE